jgi:hypothetical protein
MSGARWSRANYLAPSGLTAEVPRGGELAVVRIVRRAAARYELAIGLVRDALDLRAQAWERRGHDAALPEVLVELSYGGIE